MLKNVQHIDGELEGEFYCKLFAREVRFMAEQGAGTDYIEQCVSYLNSLREDVVEALCEASIRYCNEFLDDIGEEMIQFTKPADVLKLVDPNILIVPDPEGRTEPVVHMELDCEWEIEHGMEWVVRGDQVLYVGSFNSENPWGDYAEKDSWNYA
ncbi:hypothetical protein DNH61_05885 [Paenibacillus sambharensis]|uniref:DUF6985 domain-containing protein n=1 Tax=Paenibacillus sambharensis TaxID=1803190 RepID=A0A2W1LYZ0_9BACL|nr:hypothetical protein [Paenibacillus sambharensis]PZD96727.1 hypothetical protein DNH61_05885 [Paenibacillus sambharensis]